MADATRLIIVTIGRIGSIRTRRRLDSHPEITYHGERSATCQHSVKRSRPFNLIPLAPPRRHPTRTTRGGHSAL
jgi:hypothetical protein